MKKLIGIILGIILLGSVLMQGIDAKKSDYNIQYQTLPNKFAKTPTFCTKEPAPDPVMPESIVPILMKKVKSNLDAWVGPLKSNSKRDAKWDINYIVISRADQSKFDYAKCDVVISFAKTPPAIQNQNVELLGLHYFKDGRSYVEIYYQGYGICETRDDTWVYWYTCEQDSPKLIVAMEAILRHELGHAMGLGHYTSELTAQLKGRGHQSSVMVPIIDVLADPTHVSLDPELLEIMPVDIAKLREIYGDGGWGNQPQVEKKISAPKPITKTITVKKGQTIIEKISGVIPAEMYKKGYRADVNIVKPDGTTQTQKIGVSSDGKFVHSFSVTDDTKSGKYQIVISYFGKQVKQVTYQVRR